MDGFAAAEAIEFSGRAAAEAVDIRISDFSPVMFRSGVWIIWLLGISLFLLHQDFWFWDDATLVFGFMPIGLAYHALYSILAALLWALAVKIAWPSRIEQWADAPEGGSSS